MVLVIAHRGASHACRENTVDAFEEARRQGADMVELDARFDGDGRVVVHHDPVVAGVGPLWTSPRVALPEWLPTLDRALDACGDLRVNIELKALPHEPDHDPERRLADAVVDLVDRRGERARVLVSSFDLRAVDRVRELDGSIATAWLTLATWDQARAADTAASHGHVALHPQDPAATAELVAHCHGLGLAVNTWTVDDPARMRDLAAAGVDGIVTNEPDVAVATLRPPATSTPDRPLSDR